MATCSNATLRHPIFARNSNDNITPVIEQKPFELESLDTSNAAVPIDEQQMLSNKPITTSSKGYLAKLNWWYSPTQPLELNSNSTIETALATNNYIGKNVIRSSEDFEKSEDLLKDSKSKNIASSNENLEQQMFPTERNSKKPIVANFKNNNTKSFKSKANFRSSFSQTSTSQTCSKTFQYQSSDDDASQDSQFLLKDQRPCTGLLNLEEEEEMIITGYNRSRIRTTVCWICIVLSGGLLRLFMHWWRHLYLIATHKPCPLEEAEKVLIEENFQEKHKVYYVKRIYNLNAARLRIEIESKAASKETENTRTETVQPKKEDNAYLTLHFGSAQFKKRENARVFNCKQLRYAWDTQTKSFQRLKGLDFNVSSAYFHQQKGLSTQEQFSRRLIFGPNEITVPYKSATTLLFLEVLNPFYVFQIFSVILWFAYDYYYYACVIVLMSVFGITMSILQTKKNQDALRKTVLNSGNVAVMNDKGEIKEIQTQLLVPGDLIEIPRDGCTMHCDAILLSGNCIVDESMLTGESVPITKTPLPGKRDVIFDKKEHARHTLFCGTKVIQTRYIGSEKVFAMVINTGNITAKGGLIRSILHPPPVDYKFEQDSYKFIAVLGLIAAVGFLYTLVTKILRQVDPVKIAVESLDLITIVVPPALPAAMTVGRLYAQKRLEKNNIYCISPRSINVAGSIDCCCFDKTGTLTEDGLDMWGVVPKSATNQFQIPIKEIDRLPNDNFLFGMATCHSITILNGKIVGDPLDLKMFESTGWILEDPKGIPDNQKYDVIYPTIIRQPKRVICSTIENSADDCPKMQLRQTSMDDLLADVGLLDGENSNDHGIVREFPFSSNLQRMAVITRRLCENNFNVYCKGSPEMIQKLCRPNSIPDDYAQHLASFAKQGYRVIALSYKKLGRKLNYTKVLRLSRESVECDLEFLGFVVLENRLKADTTNVIQTLNKANIRTVMVTGDNILTAVSVARDCGIVNPAQAVITVNVRYKFDEMPHIPTITTTTTTTQCNYELYYTLDLGNEGMRSTAEDNLAANGDTIINAPSKFENGDIKSLNSVGEENTLRKSNSISSVETCETWTNHENEAELGQLPSSSANKLQNVNPQGNHHHHHHHWRKSYCFAMVGNTWHIVREFFPEQLRFFITRGAIFARMSPEQKQALIVELQSIDYSVAMCGDGANDCGALKVAQTGISLSETESSIASPFTSRNPTISSVPNVIREGRTALVTSFGIFKYMATYSMVQFISVMILYSIDSNLTDKQYLYVDLFMISVFAFFFGKTESYQGQLVKEVPLSSLISLAPLASIILHLVVVVIFQVAGWFQLHQQMWFEPFKPADEAHLGCYENYTMFAISSFQYIILAFVFSKGPPYRKPIWANVPFCLAMLINLLVVVYLVIYPAPVIADFFQLIVPPSMDFRYWMLFYGATNFIVHVFIEHFVVEFLLLKKFQKQREQNMRTSNLKHMQIEYDLQNIKHWPQITDVFETNGNLSQYTEDITKHTYVEISAEQNVDFSSPTNNALIGFFDNVTATTTTTTPHTKILALNQIKSKST